MSAVTRAKFLGPPHPIIELVPRVDFARILVQMQRHVDSGMRGKIKTSLHLLLAEWPILILAIKSRMLDAITSLVTHPFSQACHFSCAISLAHQSLAKLWPLTLWVHTASKVCYTLGWVS